jgi:4-hydroxy-tetrahydrodipicolinate synthase
MFSIRSNTNMSSKELKGVIPALITPMKEDGTIDMAAMERNTAYLADSGVQGFFVNGTTSEGPILSRSEKRESVRLVKSVSGGRQAICAACIAPSANLVIEEIHDLEPIEPDYIVCVTPFYFPVNQQVIFEHYSQIAKSTKIPIIFYDIPQHTRNPIELETRIRLVESGLGAGLKDSSGDFAAFSKALLASPKKDFAWIQGDDMLDAYSMAIGARGMVTGLSNINPGPYLKLFELAQKGDVQGLIATQAKINEIGRVIPAAGGRVIAAIKAAVAHLGRCEPWLRFTGLTANDTERAAVNAVVDGLQELA